MRYFCIIYNTSRALNDSYL
uniref:Uncharacterized protein n=1 Tax=Lepeophtheirus salmonis TaxID=72036 RepID=A0A0K2UX08_LEPSM